MTDAERELTGRVLDAMAGRGRFTAPPVENDAAKLLTDLMGFAANSRIGPRSYYGALYRAGVWFVGYSKPEEWPRPVCEYAQRMQPKACQCYHNSALAVMVGPADELGLMYFEGVVSLPSCPFPIEHAWLGTVAGGVAVDLTFPAADADEQSANPKFREGAVYCGIPIPSSFIRRITIRERYSRPRLGDWLTAAVDSAGGSE